MGPLAEMPYMKKLAAAHQLHHSNKYDGAPWGMFLAPQVGFWVRLYHKTIYGKKHHMVQRCEHMWRKTENHFPTTLVTNQLLYQG